jgi:hypothetical protein
LTWGPCGATRLRGVGALLAAAALVASCARTPSSVELAPASVELAGPEPVRVRVGTIDPAAFEPAGAPPGSPNERIEQLVDRFFEAGCAGPALSRTREREARHPDVVCRLPGRTPGSLVVAAYVEPREDRGDWTGPALLPHLYRALAVEERQHSFVFAAYGRREGRSPSADAKRLEEAHSGLVRAIVDLERIRTGAAAVGFRASDGELGRDLAAVSAALGEAREPLRLFAVEGRRRLRGGGIPTILLGSLRPAAAPAAPAAGAEADADRSQADRSTARAVAVFLGYLDATLPPVSATPGPARRRPPRGARGARTRGRSAGRRARSASGSAGSGRGGRGSSTAGACATCRAGSSA